MKRALVLGGGGSKGAYEIGVWKALDELGIRFDIVCGTSIGALIGTMYVQYDYDKLVKLWNNISIDDVIASGVNLEFDMDLLMSQKGKYKEFLTGYVHNKGADIRPFREMITELFDADKFFASDIDFACMCVNVTKHKAQGVLKKEMSRENGVDWLLASSACFPAFPMHVIGEDKYIDGGYSSNVPIELAKKLHADDIVAVDLKYDPKKRHKSTKHILYIQPHVSLGSFLLFDQTRIRRNRELGYLDTMKAFQRYEGTIYTFYQEENIAYYEEMIKDCCVGIEIPLKALYKQVERERYPYIALLELLANDLQLENIAIYSIQEFITLCLQAVEHSSYDTKNIDFERLKKIVKKHTISAKKESILLMLEYIKHNHEPFKLSRIMKDTYVKAYLLYQLQKKAN